MDFKILPLYLRSSSEGFLFDGRERIFCNAWDMECMMILPLLGDFQGKKNILRKSGAEEVIIFGQNYLQKKPHRIAILLSP